MDDDIIDDDDVVEEKVKPQNKRNCHILDELQSNELIDRINNKTHHNNYDDYDNQNPNIECVQM